MQAFYAVIPKMLFQSTCKLTSALGDWVGGFVCWLLACYLEYCMAGRVLVVYQVNNHPTHKHL